MEEKRFRVAIAGCGAMSGAWVPYTLTRSDTRIVALADPCRENAEKLKKRFSLDAEIFSDLAEAIRKTGANLVYDITPPEVHKQILKTAVENGCDVFGEKPLSDTLESARDMIATAKEYGKTYAVMQNRRWLKPTIGLKKILDSGWIGELGMISADFFINPGYGTFRDMSLEHALLTDMAVHTFDMVRFMTGKEPVSVYCHEFSMPGSWFHGKPAAICIFEMTDGVVFQYRGCWCARTMLTKWEASWRADGNLGTAVWDENDNQYVEVVKTADARSCAQKNGTLFEERIKLIPENNWEGLAWHSGCIDNMYESVVSGEKPMTVCEDNIKSLAMVFAAIRSAKEKRKVEVVW